MHPWSVSLPTPSSSTTAPYAVRSLLGQKCGHHSPLKLLQKQPNLRPTAQAHNAKLKSLRTTSLISPPFTKFDVYIGAYLSLMRQAARLRGTTRAHKAVNSETYWKRLTGKWLTRSVSNVYASRKTVATVFRTQAKVLRLICRRIAVAQPRYPTRVSLPRTDSGPSNCITASQHSIWAYAAGHTDEVYVLRSASSRGSQLIRDFSTTSLTPVTEQGSEALSSASQEHVVCLSRGAQSLIPNRSQAVNSLCSLHYIHADRSTNVQLGGPGPANHLGSPSSHVRACCPRL